jgi:hypothetical protein
LESESASNAAASSLGCNRSDFWNFASSLSKDAEVYFPGSTQFDQFTQRWSNLESPAVNITVLPATEKDVVEIVSFINLNPPCPCK